MVVPLTALHIALMVIAAAIFVAAAANDAMSYRIPNYMCASLLVLFPLFVATAPSGIDWKQNLAVFGLVAVSGFAMFLGQLAGAGDIKLLSVAGLWAGPHFIAVLLVITAIAGGIVSLAMAALTHYRQRKSEAEDTPQLAKVPIPYGVAIAAGGLATLGMIAQPILLPN